MRNVIRLPDMVRAPACAAMVRCAAAVLGMARGEAEAYRQRRYAVAAPQAKVERKARHAQAGASGPPEREAVGRGKRETHVEGCCREEVRCVRGTTRRGRVQMRL